MRAVAESASTLGDELAGAHNVLLLASPMGSSDSDACSSLVSGDSPAGVDVLSVTFNQTPDARIEQWRTADGPTDPANLGFIVVGERVRSATDARPSSEGPDLDGLGPTIASVSSPGDLTGIGIELGNFFEEWADDGNELRLCFHTLTTLLQYADLRSVYRFVHALTGRVRSARGVAHYHLDPAAHDERTVNTLLALFDAVAEHGPEGDWVVRRRR